MKKISVEDFAKERAARADAQFIDVREPAEQAQSRMAAFLSLPLSGLSESSAGGLDKSKTTYLLCRTGTRACRAADRLAKMGFTDLRVIEGGIVGCEAAGMGVIKDGPSRGWAGPSKKWRKGLTGHASPAASRSPRRGSWRSLMPPGACPARA